MPKQSPIPDDLDRPYWEAANNDKFVMQYFPDSDTLYFPPVPADPKNGSTNFVWKEMSGKGTIYSYSVIYDTPIASLQADQPYNCAVVQLDDDPSINMLSHLPGTPVDQVPIGAKVEVMFQVTPATGQKVPEWRVVG